MLSSLQNNVIAAIILVLIIILGSLGIRSGFLVGVSIPGAFLSGILALSIMGFTVNIVVLFALILSVGLLVDGAIVVVEYADRKINEGLSIITDNDLNDKNDKKIDFYYKLFSSLKKPNPSLNKWDIWKENLVQPLFLPV